MSELSFNRILDGVSLALHTAFPDRQIHGGEVRQGLRPGDFNVIMPAASHAQEVGSRCRRSPTLDVIYYPRGAGAECRAIADQLTLILGSITTPEGDVIHSTRMECQITDDVLHVLVAYAHFGYTPQTSEIMGTLKIEQEG